MKNSLMILMFSCASLSACATVDVANMASQQSVKPANAAQVNSVKRLSDKLYVAFHKEDWVQKAKGKKTQSTASILLKGLQASTVTPASFTQIKTREEQVVLDELAQDIKRAEHYIFQVTKSAEAYLAASDESVNLRYELVSLEKALLTSRQAEQKFISKLNAVNVENHDDMSAYTQSVLALRAITDTYGQRVRSVRTIINSAES